VRTRFGQKEPQGDRTVVDANSAGGPTQGQPEGLSEAELEAETAEELPDREAMSIVGLPGVGLTGGPVALPDVPDPVDPSVLPDQS
jgi:hypothetical protein